MESLYEQGRKEMQPNTTSFNTVIDALARSGERGSEYRAEVLLERMEELSNRHAELKDTCKPNHVVSLGLTRLSGCVLWTLLKFQ
jgi:hypothetical protein